ncbi:metal ABC transporter permease [Treponema sp.]
MNLEIIIIASVVSVACVIPGVFLLLRRMALMSDAISHAILPGIVAGFFIAGTLDSPLPMIGAVAASMATVFLTELLYKTRLVKSDAAIGIVFPAMFSLGVIMVTLYAGNVHLDTDAVLLGELAFAPLDRTDIFGFSVPRSLVKMSGILALNIGLALLFFKELKLSTFDAGLSASLGFAPALLNYGLMLTTSITAVGAFDSVGAVLVVALMIAPAATALLLTDRLSHMIILAALIAIASSILGFFLARALDAGIAGAMASMTGFAFVLAFFFSPKSGLVTHARIRARMKKEFDVLMLAVHILHHEGTDGMEAECSEDHLTDHINWTAAVAKATVEKSLVSGMVERRGSLLRLTEQGRAKARTVLVQ